jgi:primosomal protein N'
MLKKIVNSCKIGKNILKDNKELNSILNKNEFRQYKNLQKSITKIKNTLVNLRNDIKTLIVDTNKKQELLNITDLNNDENQKEYTEKKDTLEKFKQNNIDRLEKENNRLKYELKTMKKLKDYEYITELTRLRERDRIYNDINRITKLDTINQQKINKLLTKVDEQNKTILKNKDTYIKNKNFLNDYKQFLDYKKQKNTTDLSFDYNVPTSNKSNDVVETFDNLIDYNEHVLHSSPNKYTQLNTNYTGCHCTNDCQMDKELNQLYKKPKEFEYSFKLF